MIDFEQVWVKLNMCLDLKRKSPCYLDLTLLFPHFYFTVWSWDCCCCLQPQRPKKLASDLMVVGVVLSGILRRVSVCRMSLFSRLLPIFSWEKKDVNTLWSNTTKNPSKPYSTNSTSSLHNVHSTTQDSLVLHPRPPTNPLFFLFHLGFHL